MDRELLFYRQNLNISKLFKQRNKVNLMRSHKKGRQIVRNVQCAEGRGCWRKRMLLRNTGDRGSDFAPSERRQTSNAYQLHERIENCECIKFNDTAVRTVQT